MAVDVGVESRTEGNETLGAGHWQELPEDSGSGTKRCPLTENQKAAAWRGAKVILSGLVAAILTGIVNNENLLADLLTLNFSAAFYRSLEQTVVVALFMALLKFYGIKLPPLPKENNF